jgi:hypothetical protein
MCGLGKMTCFSPTLQTGNEGDYLWERARIDIRENGSPAGFVEPERQL